MAQQQNETDIESLSLDELRKLALQEASGEQQAPSPDKKPRDEQGRFLASQDDAQDATATEDEQQEEEPQKKLYRRVVDIGDGVDPEVFEADSLEELVDKIADAKAHATRKIRSQEATIRKTKEAEAPKPRQFSEDEEFVYSQELMNKPTQAFAKMFKEMVGMDITEFKTVTQKVNAIEQAKNKNEAIVQFVTTHPEYEDNKRSADLMTMALAGRETTAENLEKAYQSLVTKGLLGTGDDKQSSVQDEDEQTTLAIPARSVTKTPSQGTKKSSGLKAGNPVPVKSNEPSEADLYNMPLDKLKELGNRALAGR